MPYDVETTMLTLPPTTDPAYKPLRAAIKSVNLMTYLLGNVTYSQLYRDEFGIALSRIVERAEKLVLMPALSKLKEGAYTNPDISIQLRDGLLAIQRIPGIANLTLGRLFYAKASDQSEIDLIAALDKIYSNSLNTNNECELAHFCCPFRYRQEAGVKELDKGILDIFLDYVGSKTMYNLFTEPKSLYSDAQKHILGEARLTHYILGDMSARPGKPYPPVALEESKKGVGGVGPMSNPFGNYSKCSGGVCVTTTNASDWCNEANGSCSAASTP